MKSEFRDKTKGRNRGQTEQPRRLEECARQSGVKAAGRDGDSGDVQTGSLPVRFEVSDFRNGTGEAFSYPGRRFSGTRERFLFAGRRFAGGGRPQRAFTMIEIAISLAVIGFALLAIIGILPLGMNVQKDNREETIIDQDANVLMNLIRTGVQGDNDLTNYVVAITNAWTEYSARGNTRQVVASGIDWYTPTRSSVQPSFPLNSGFRIIGLLSTPRFIPLVGNRGMISGFRSNYVAAIFRAMSGPASEKFPQLNPDMLGLSLTYRFIPEILTYGSSISDVVTNAGWDPSWVDYADFPTNSPQYWQRFNYALYAAGLHNDLHDIRLIFRWPVLPNGVVPRTGQREVFRTMTTGSIILTNDYTSPSYPLFFLRPTLFTSNSL